MALMFGVAAPVVFATTSGESVFLNPPELDGNLRVSDFGWHRQQADDFRLTGSYLTITGVDWWGGYKHWPDPAATDNFVIRFFSSTHGKPSAVPFAEMPAVNLTRTEEYLDAEGVLSAHHHNCTHHDDDTIYHYSAELPFPLPLNPETTYYLSIVNDTSSRWGWLAAEGGARSHYASDLALEACWGWVDRSQWYRTRDGRSWRTSCRNGNLSFELFATPEPATLLLFGMGGLAVMRRRRA